MRNRFCRQSEEKHLRNPIKHLLILFVETAFCIAGAQCSRKFNKSFRTSSFFHHFTSLKLGRIFMSSKNHKSDDREEGRFFLILYSAVEK